MHLRSLALLSLLACLFSPVRADFSWRFDLTEGLPIENVAGSVGAPLWVGDLDRSLTTGRGALRLRNVGVEKSLACAPLSAVADSQVVWLLVRLDGWKFTGQGWRDFTFGLTERVNPHRAVVQIALRGSAQRGLHVVGQALRTEEGAQNTELIHIGPPEQSEPLTLVLEYRPAERVFNLHRSDSDGSLTLLGSGLTSPRRHAHYAHISLHGDLGVTEGEFVDVGTVVLAADRASLRPASR